MPLFKFTRKFDWVAPHAASPSGRATFAYKPIGHAIEVPEEVAEAAEAAGAGTPVKARKVSRTKIRDNDE